VVSLIVANWWVAIWSTRPERAFEFVGRFEEHGWKLAGTIVPIAYTA